MKTVVFILSLFIVFIFMLTCLLISKKEITFLNFFRLMCILDMEQRSVV